VFTEVCDVIVTMWFGALLLDLRRNTKFWDDGPSNRKGSIGCTIAFLAAILISSSADRL
jgi:hypothetical protein